MSESSSSPLVLLWIATSTNSKLIRFCSYYEVMHVTLPLGILAKMLGIRASFSDVHSTPELVVILVVILVLYYT